MTESPLILTLALDAELFARLDALRRSHFPPERNVVPAHVTLFHDVPGGEAAACERVAAAVALVPPLVVTVGKPRFLGRGVAFEVDCPGLSGLRKSLAAGWDAGLTAQDRQPYRPHCTVMNKADPADARAVFEAFRAAWEPATGTATGLLLWRYLGGPWELAREFAFSG